MPPAPASGVRAPPTDGYGPGPYSAWMDIDWRPHRRQVEIAGRPVNVVELGEGPPVVLLHGLAGAWVSWLETIPALARTHRVVALDLPGFGRSPVPVEPISIAGYARAVEELMDRLGIESAALVGISMGAMIAAELAATRPERVSSLVLLAPVGVSIERRDPRVLRALARAVAPLGAWTGARAEAIAARPRTRGLFLRMAAARPAGLPAPLVAEQLKGEGKAGWRGAVAAMSSAGLPDRLGRISCPTLVVWGRRDRMVPVADAEVFERAIPGARKVVFEDTGHSPQLERPDAFNALLLDHLARGGL